MRTSASRDRARLVLIIAGLIALVLIGNRSGEWIMSQLNFHLNPSTEPLLHRMIMTAIGLYIVLMVIPFCPGIEIGLGMIVLFGANIVPLVYAATVASLLLAFLLGRLVPPRVIICALDVLRLHRARDLLRRLEPLSQEERLQLIQGSPTPRFLHWLLRYRYIAIAIALNTPGNVVIGDGGGIAMAAGFSRLFSFPAFALTVLIAVLPVPLAILLTE